MSDVAQQTQFNTPAVDSPTGKAVRMLRLDDGHPRVARAEETLRDLRQRMERHHDQEVQLGRLYQGWQECWSQQCDQMQQQVAKLEAYLTAWLPRAERGPTLTVVDGE